MLFFCQRGEAYPRSENSSWAQEVPIGTRKIKKRVLSEQQLILYCSQRECNAEQCSMVLDNKTPVSACHIRNMRQIWRLTSRKFTFQRISVTLLDSRNFRFVKFAFDNHASCTKIIHKNMMKITCNLCTITELPGKCNMR